MKGIAEIEHLIDLTISACENWLQHDNGGRLRFIDPVEGYEISAHYGATHTAAAFIIYGKLKNNTSLLEKGKTLLISIIDRWDENKTLPEFHADFNNFALCVAYDSLIDNDLGLCEKIKSKIIATPDSNHNTINWLPMRWYVNLKRYEWSGKIKFKKAFEECKSIINEAINDDGSIEDRLPKGMSFNLQYDIATVSVLQFLKSRGQDINLSKELGFLMEIIAPDGDINYQGRGTNQIFAWGLWVYLLSSSNKLNELNHAISFLSNKVPVMLEKKNLMLNKWNGTERYLWWDYHYSSVYTAHFLFWLVLSVLDYKKSLIFESKSVLQDSGVSVYKSTFCFVAAFNGRNEYLAEKGPVISAIWLKKYGMLTKGTFGPWGGSFGNENTYGDVVLRNYCGLLKVNKDWNWGKRKILKKLWTTFKINNYFSISPYFADFVVKEKRYAITITFYNNKKKNVIFNFPILDSVKTLPKISLFVDGKPVVFQNNIKFRNQYGWCNVFQSNVSNAKEWVLKIE